MEKSKSEAESRHFHHYVTERMNLSRNKSKKVTKAYEKMRKKSATPKVFGMLDKQNFTVHFLTIQFS